MKNLILIALFIIAVTACGFGSKSTSSSGNSNNSNAINSSGSTSSANRDSGVPKDTSPLTLRVSEMVGTGSFDSSKEGRRVTVEGGLLDKISYSSVTVRDGSGYAFECSGSFSDYMSSAPRIDELTSQHRSPSVTVMGTYGKSSYSDSAAALSSCIITDLKK